jgi:glycosyltransferase involved in cell wall biosynthesis
MKIIVCNWKDRTHPGAGGAEVYTQECASRWAAWGHDVTLVCAAVAGQPAREVVDGVTIIRHGSRIGVYGQTARYLREHAADADIVIDEINTRPFFAHRHCGNTPVVALVHQVAREVWFNEVPWPVAIAGRYVLEPRWLSKYENVPTLTVSDSSADSLRAYGFRNIEIVPEGVEIDPEVQSALLGVPKASKPTLAFCGRLVSMKRPEDAIAAFVEARAILSGEVELHVVGGGPLEDKLRKQATPGVVVHGRVSQLEKFRIMASAHALLATSVREGWGLVVSEAAAVGTPAIAYDIPGLRDSVAAANGVLSAENPGALAAAIVEHLPALVAHPRAPLAHGGAHSWDTVAADVLEHLHRVAGRPGSVRNANRSGASAISASAVPAPLSDSRAARISTANRLANRPVNSPVNSPLNSGV